jgi:ABC-type branched-subunit amino acid transport system substrate-binding protein
VPLPGRAIELHDAAYNAGLLEACNKLIKRCRRCPLTSMNRRFLAAYHDATSYARPPLIVLLGVVACFAGVVTGRPSGHITPTEARGKQIYLHGTSQSGKEILAYIGQSSVEVSGSAMPCANCHGLDGQGKPEGGVTPSNLTWEALTKPYGVTHADGRHHPPYTERGVELAISRGIDPAGNKLSDVMPRFDMSREDMADLIAYLKLLGKDWDPGIGDDEIVIGTMVPSGALAEMGRSTKEVMTALVDEINSQGGIYNRRLKLEVVETAETPESQAANLQKLVNDDRVFAIVGAFIAGSEGQTLPIITRTEVPLIGPVTLYPQINSPVNRDVFYLLSGIVQQARALAEFAGKRSELKQARIALVHNLTEQNLSVANAITDECKKLGMTTPRDYPYRVAAFDMPPSIDQIRRSDQDVVFFSGTSKELMSFLQAADHAHWYPYVMQPGSAGGSELFDAPAGFEGKLFFSVPTSPADQNDKASAEFYRFAEKYKLQPNHMAVQFLAYSAAKVLVEGLRRAGRDVSREKLIEALEGLYEYQTGVTRAVTYGPNRRIGAMGAYVLQVDIKGKRLAPASGWIEVN